MNLFRLLFFITSFFYVCELSAQFEKGTLQFGADAVPQIAFGDGSPFQSWNVMPEVSYFFLDNISFGLSGMFRDFSDPANTNFREYNVGLLSRYYLIQKGRFSTNIETYIGLGERSGDSDTREEMNFRTSTLNLGVGVGMTYQIFKNVAISTSYRINQVSFTKAETNLIDSSAGFRFGLRVNLNTSK